MSATQRRPTRPRAVLRSAAFRREREDGWRELEKLLDRTDRGGTRRLGAAELARLAILYRAALSSLSVARSISLDRNVLEYLEGLCARAYFVVYGPKRRVGAAVREFLVHGLPDAARRAAGHIGVSAGVLTLGALTGYAIVTRDMDRFHSLVAEELAQGRGPGATDETLRDVLYGTDDVSSLLLFASFLFTHNSQVGMLVFALGVLAGAPVFVLLFLNGLILGAFAALYSSRGMGLELCAWIAPHGVPELLSLVLCGAAGLVIGESLVFPGEHSRLDNLRKRGPDAAVLVGGAILLDLYAAGFEGFFRQMVHAPAARFVVAAVNACLLAAYFLWPRRRRAP